MLRDRYSSINYASLAGHLDHGLLLGLTDNDHVAYVNAVGDTTTINLTLTGQSISGVTIDSAIDHDALLNVHQDVNTDASPQFARVKVDDASTYIDKDGSGNMTLTDAVIGTRTLKQLGCPTYKYIKATAQSEGDLHLSDATNWGISKANIKIVRVITSSTSWDLYILQNDNGYAADDATIPKMKLMGTMSGDANIFVDLPYEDEDASDEVHLYYLDNSGANTADIYITGFELL